MIITIRYGVIDKRTYPKCTKSFAFKQEKKHKGNKMKGNKNHSFMLYYQSTFLIVFPRMFNTLLLSCLHHSFVDP